MSSASANKTIISTQPRHKNGDQPFVSAQFVPKKMPRSEQPTEANIDDVQGSLDDLTFLRLPEVKAVTGLSKTSLYMLIREKSFPAPVHLGPRAVAWVRSEVRQWALERVQASRSAA